MRTPELYARFRKRIEDLANSTRPPDTCLAELREVQRQFDAEVAAFGSANAKLLREQLCEQFEMEALRTTQGHRRDVLVVALKLFERDLN